MRFGHLEREVHIATPQGDGPFPAVLVLSEALGLNNDIRSITDRMAGHGFLAMAPDYTGGGISCLARSMWELRRRRGRTFDVTRAAIRWLRDAPNSNGKVGVVGFCLGGGFALMLGTEEDVAAVAPAYGEIPGDHMIRALCPVVGSYGRKDWLVQGQPAERMREVLDASGIDHDVKVYDQVGHSFLNEWSGGPLARPLRRITNLHYDGEVANDAWGRIVTFFEEHLA